MAERYAVLGAGHGGKAMAAHLALLGAEVALWNRTYDHISIIQKRGGIELESTEGGPHGFGTLKLVTSEISERWPLHRSSWLCFRPQHTPMLLELPPHFSRVAKL